ncbi:restriction endonuclease subunit S [Corynebacterium sp. UMB10321]|uniref:restriction endonuclease subunit S n=1 Tax=Corynebacterium sp. UMB10321 TaxID=3046312 RepID=UPI00254BEE5F|nr:restriction endonuclease subunit S [Corynebacterium sp. UMB10321]MDK8243464.1 restriction endonuclease subunit S [Corynebacterium sp. UMB10321]
MVSYPEGWREVSLGNIANLTMGQSPLGSSLGSVGVEFHQGHSEFSGKNLGKSMIRTTTPLRMASCGAIVISVRAPVGDVALLDRDVCIGRGLCAVSVGPEIYRDYLYYSLKAHENTWSEFSTGTTFEAVNADTVRDFCVTIPSLSEQRAIAEVLSGFDEHLANLDELIMKKKAIRDGAMKELVSGNSRLGGFGDKWTDISFENMVAPKARIGWQNLRTDEYLDSGYSYIIGGTNFSDGTVDLASCKFVSEERFRMDPAIQVNQGDVLVTKDGTIGKVAVVPRLEKPATLNSGVYVFRPVDGVARRFLYWVLRSDIFDRFIADLSAGSTIKHLYQKDLGRFHFRAPKDVPEQEAIADVMSSFEEDLLVLKEERKKVERLKLGAMDDLLTGRVRLTIEEEAA